VSIENKDGCPEDLGEAIKFVRNRMLRFWKRARIAALEADAISDKIRKASRSKYTAETYHESLGFADVTASPGWKDAVSTQQMYDRWTMREAAVLQALCALRGLK
jgi:hypothetical protein